MDFLRDPIWQFVGVILSAVAIIPLLWQGWRLITHASQSNTSAVNPNTQFTKPVTNRHTISTKNAEVSTGRMFAGDVNMSDKIYNNNTPREHTIHIDGGKVSIKGDMYAGNVQLDEWQKKNP